MFLEPYPAHQQQQQQQGQQLSNGQATAASTPGAASGGATPEPLQRHQLHHVQVGAGYCERAASQKGFNHTVLSLIPILEAALCLLKRGVNSAVFIIDVEHFRGMVNIYEWLFKFRYFSRVFSFGK